MFGQYSYHNLTRKYITVFGQLFNEIEIRKKDRKNNEINRIMVPIQYGPKKKFIQRIQGKFDVPQGITLPRMSFEITSMNYSAARKTDPIKRIQIKKYLEGNERTFVYTPIPVDLFFTLAIYTKNEDDMYQIVEQIMPYFQPSLTQEVKLIDDDPESVLKIPFKLVSFTPDQTYEGGFEERETKFFNLEFVCNAYYLTPEYTGKRIKELDIGIFNEVSDEVNASSRISIASNLSGDISNRLQNIISEGNENIENDLENLGLTPEQIASILTYVSQTQHQIAEKITTDTKKAIEEALNIYVFY